VFGFLWLGWQMLFLGGHAGTNVYGLASDAAEDYLRNDQGQPCADGSGVVINEVTKLHPVIVAKVERPTTIASLREILQTTSGPISVGGGRFSMGGQTASPGSLHLDLRGLNAITDFSREQKWIRVQAGTRWCDIQHYVDSYGLSVKIMQTYANFTVGGTLSVNAHGRYIGFGPTVLSVRQIDVMLADGSVRKASRTENPEIFMAAIGGYGAIGIIIEVELDLADNIAIECTNQKITRTDYSKHFCAQVRDDPLTVLHNGDMYPPDYRRINSVTWRKTERAPTTPTRLMPLNNAYPVMRYFIWAYTETLGGHWRREHIFDTIFFFRNRVYWRNYEAGYDVAELEPKSRRDDTYVLQEYFIPVRHFDAYTDTLTEILNRHHVKILNISIRHALPDSGTLLSWAREEVFAFVVYYKQGTSPSARGAVAVWTRELIEAAIALGGTYYLPYQAHATPAQFHRAYPRARELFALKRQLDPDYRLRHVLWNTYYSHQNE
jgi:FAD/FMN-containing dehydrogenase